jgi:hypothetical protein
MNRHQFDLAVFAVLFVAASIAFPIIPVVVFLMSVFGFAMLALADFIVRRSGEDEERP